MATKTKNKAAAEAAAAFGRLGGLARAKAQTPAQRRALALKAIRARWKKGGKKKAR